jgi:membrane associated rhomboid family serine protease
MAFSRQITPATRPWPAGQPSVTAILIVLLAAVGSAEWFFTLLDRGETVRNGAVTQWLGLSASSIAEGHTWQFFTFMFLHLSPFPLHLAANLLGLYFVGREVEPIIGAKHFLGLFFAGNFFGGLIHWIGALQGWVPADLPLVGISADFCGSRSGPDRICNDSS